MAGEDLHFFALSHIFSFLSYFEIKNIAKLVCKKWQEAAEDSSLWRDASALITMKSTADVQANIGLTLTPTDSDNDNIARLARDLLGRGITKIQFHRGCPREIILAYCKIAGENIIGLSLRGCKSLGKQDFLTLLQDAPNIDNLDVSNFYEFGSLIHMESFDDILREHDVLRNLTHFDFGHTSIEMTHNYALFLSYLSHHSPELCFVGLSGIRIDEKMEKKLFESLCQFKDIKRIDLSHTELSSEFVINLLSTFIIEEISFPVYFNNCLEFNTCFSKMESVKKLDMSSVKAFSYLNCINMIKKINIKLESLCIPGCPNVRTKMACNKKSHCYLLGGKSLTLCSNPFSSLKELNLSDCGLLDKDVLFFCEVSPQIQNLSLSSSYITDQSMQNICSCMASLKKLDISKCYQLTDKAFLAEDISAYNDANGLGKPGIKNLRRLEWLDFSNCKNITDSGLEPLTFLQNLRHLFCHGCSKVTDDGLTNMIVKLTLLTELNISHLEISDDCIDIVSKSLPFLTSLNVSWVPSITNKSLISIAKNCEYLRYLDIAYCDGITEYHAADFYKAFGQRLVEFNCSYDFVDDL